MAGNHVPRGDIWLGDALRAIDLLTADGEAAEAIVACLGLAAGRPKAAQETMLPPRIRRTARPPREVETGGTAGAQRPPEKDILQEDAAETGGYRLPSTLEPMEILPEVEPAWLAETPPLHLDHRPETPRPPRPLLPRLRRRAILARALATRVEEGPPDLRRIVRLLAGGRSLRRLPRLPRRTLRHGVEVWVDGAPWLQPFLHDQLELLDYLRRLIPADRLHIADIDGGPYSALSEPPRQVLSPRATSQAPVLLLSDLGAGYRPQAQTPASPAVWRAFTAALRRSGREAVALIPFAPHRWPRVAGLAMLHWHERLNLGCVARARMSRPGASPGPISTEAAILELATVLSPAVRITPWLLREARLLLRQEPGTEADLYYSRLVQSPGSTALMLDPLVARRLRAGLAGSGRLDAALALVRQGRAGGVDGNGIEEALIELELRGTLDDSEAEQVLRPALKALAEPGETATAAATWAVHAWTRFSSEVRALPSARRLAYAAAGLVDTSAWLREPSGVQPALPAESAWLFAHHGLPTVDLSVELRRYPDGSTNLVIQPALPATNALHRIELARTEPLWLQVSGGRDDDAQTVRIAPDEANQIDVADVSERYPLVLQALGGEAYRLSGIANLVDALRLSVLPSADNHPYSAVILDQRSAIVFSPRLSPPAAGEWLSFRDPADGPPVRVRVLGPLDERRERAVVAELADGWGGARPLDLELCPEGLEERGPGSTHVLISLQPGDRLTERHLTYAGEGSYEGFDGFLEDEVPALLVSPGGHWRLVWNASPNWQPASGGPPPSVYLESDALESVRARAAEIVSGQWKGFLLAEPGREELAFRLWDELATRMGSGRIVHDHDGRILGFPETLRATIAASAAFILVGSRNPAEWMAPELVEALAAGKPLLWVPLDDLPADALPAWPEPPSAPSLRVAYLLAGTDIERIAGQIAQWKPGVHAEALSESVRVSLRGRFAKLIEKRVENALGLFQMDFSDGIRLSPAELPADGLPCLLFIHGEGADTLVSFGGLLETPDREVLRLRERYGDRIFAWQYRSITVGPIANAAALARRLSSRTRLHLVTHGAGGLLGELLCLGERVETAGQGAIDPAEMAYLAELPQAEPVHIQALEALSQLLGEHRGFRIERFVRVACPMAGTSVYGQGFESAAVIARFIPGLNSIWTQILGFDRLLSDPEASPGLTALTAGRNPQPLLTSRIATHSALTVVAGVAQPEGLLQKIGHFAAGLAVGDAASKGDLVVPLASAFGGLERVNGVDYLVETGPSVNHFNLFQNPRIRRAVVDALLSANRPAEGFQHAATLAELQKR